MIETKYRCKCSKGRFHKDSDKYVCKQCGNEVPLGFFEKRVSRDVEFDLEDLHSFLQYTRTFFATHNIDVEVSYKTCNFIGDLDKQSNPFHKIVLSCSQSNKNEKIHSLIDKFFDQIKYDPFKIEAYDDTSVFQSIFNIYFYED